MTMRDVPARPHHEPTERTILGVGRQGGPLADLTTVGWCRVANMLPLFGPVRSDQSARQFGVPSSALWYVMGPIPQIAITAGSLPSFLTPS